MHSHIHSMQSQSQSQLQRPAGSMAGSRLRPSRQVQVDQASEPAPARPQRVHLVQSGCSTLGLLAVTASTYPPYPYGCTPRRSAQPWETGHAGLLSPGTRLRARSRQPLRQRENCCLGRARSCRRWHCNPCLSPGVGCSGGRTPAATAHHRCAGVAVTGTNMHMATQARRNVRRGHWAHLAAALRPHQL